MCEGRRGVTRAAVDWGWGRSSAGGGSPGSICLLGGSRVHARVTARLCESRFTLAASGRCVDSVTMWRHRGASCEMAASGGSVDSVCVVCPRVYVVCRRAGWGSGMRCVVFANNESVHRPSVSIIRCEGPPATTLNGPYTVSDVMSHVTMASRDARAT